MTEPMPDPVLDALPLPIIQAPMAGGPSTPELAAAVANAGGMGFVAAVYKPPDDLQANLQKARGLTDGPLGVNVFSPAAGPADPEIVRRYAERLAPEGGGGGGGPGGPRAHPDRD